jgi:3-keto-disaccharide hydrolase
MVKLGSGRLRSAAIIAALTAMAMLAAAPSAFSKRKEKAAPPPAPTPTFAAMPTPTPETHVWNFDSDTAGQSASGWKAVLGDWQVIADPTAPSQPNAFGLPPGRLIVSLLHALEYYPIAIVDDPTEYSDFTLEAKFKTAANRIDCSGGIVFRYVDEKNFYVLFAGCPSDTLSLARVTDGKPVTLKQQTPSPTDVGVWYTLKVTVEGTHFTCYRDNKLVFDTDDPKIAKGRIGLIARDNSEARFDNVTLTLPIGAGTGGAGAGGLPPAPPPLPSLPPPPPH